MEVALFSSGAVKISTSYTTDKEKRREIYLSEESARLLYYSFKLLYENNPSDELIERILQPSLFTKIKLWFLRRFHGRNTL